MASQGRLPHFGPFTGHLCLSVRAVLFWVVKVRCDANAWRLKWSSAKGRGEKKDMIFEMMEMILDMPASFSKGQGVVFVQFVLLWLIFCCATLPRMCS